MIRKPAADWQRRESAAVRTVRSAVSASHRGVRVARRGGHFVRGVFCFFFAAIWGLGALGGGLLGGSLATFIGVGALAALMAWGGVRAFAKAREASG